MSEAAAATSRPGRVRPLVLLFEDDQLLLMLLRDLLEDRYEVEAHSSCEGGLDLVRARHPDLVIMDCLFGGENRGYPLLQQLRQDPETADTPTILCTVDDAFLRLHERELALYRVHALAKPFDVDDLVGLIQATLGRREPRRP